MQTSLDESDWNWLLSLWNICCWIHSDMDLTQKTKPQHVRIFWQITLLLNCITVYRAEVKQLVNQK